MFIATTVVNLNGRVNMMISREEAKGIIYNEVLEATAMLATWENTEEEVECLERFIEASNMAIEALSTERPKGRWVYGTQNGADGYWCSNCNAGFKGINCEWIAKEHDFCPKCGADMRGEE